MRGALVPGAGRAGHQRGRGRRRRGRGGRPRRGAAGAGRGAGRAARLLALGPGPAARRGRAEGADPGGRAGRGWPGHRAHGGPGLGRAAEGRVIARMSDLGWAVPLRELLRTDEDGRPVDAVVPERIGGRIVEVLKDWDWSQRPAAVVAVPSTTRPQLVGSLAAGIASIG